MASETELRILITAINDTRAVINQLVTDLGRISNNLSTIGANNAFAEQDSSIKQTTVSANVAAGAFEGLGRSILGSVASIYKFIGGFRTIIATIATYLGLRTVKQFADVAARAEVLGTVLGIVGKNAGFTQTELEKTDRQVQQLGITATSSRESLSKFIQAGLNVADAPKLARAAQDLAVIAGTDSSATFQRLITNIQQMDTMGLRFMGIIVNREQAEAKYALQLNKTASQLSLVEKRQAFLNAVMTESNKLSGAYVAAMGDAGKQLTSLPRLMQELSQTIGDILLPAYSKVILNTLTFLENLKISVKSYFASGAAADFLGKAVGRLVELFLRLWNVAEQLITPLLDLFGPLTTSFVTGLLDVLELVVWALEQVPKGLLAILNLFAEFESLSDVWLLLKIGAAALAEQLAEFVLTFQDIWEGMVLTVQLLWETLWSKLPFTSKEASDKIIKDLEAKLKFLEDKQKARREAGEGPRITPAIGGAAATNFASTGELDAALQEKVVRDLGNQLKQANTELQKQAEAFNALRRSKENVTEADLKASEASLKAAKARRESLQAAFNEAVEQKKLGQAARDREDADAKAAKARNKLNTDYDETKKVLGELLKSYAADGRGIETQSQKGADAIGKMEKVIDNFYDDSIKNTDKAVTSFGEVRLSILAAFGQQTTYSDFQKFLESINSKVKESDVFLTNIKNNAAFKQQNALLQDLNKELELYTVQTSRLLEIQKTYQEILEAGTKQEIAFRTVEAQLANDVATVNALQLRQIASTLAAAEDAKDRAIVFAEEEARKKKASAKEVYSQELLDAERGFKGKAEYANKVAAASQKLADTQKKIDADLYFNPNNGLLKLNKDYYKALQDAANAYLQQRKSAADKLKEIEEKRTSLQGKAEDRAFERSLEGYDPSSQAFDIEQRLKDSIKKAQESIGTKDEAFQFAPNIERATKLADLYVEKLAQAQQNLGYINQRELEDERDRLTKLIGAVQLKQLDQQEKDAREAEKQATKNYEDTKAKLNELQGKINDIIQTKIELQVDVNDKSIEKSIAKIKNAFENITVTLNTIVTTTQKPVPTESASSSVVITSPPAQKAEGGIIPGTSVTGKEDNFLSWLTPGEFVHPVRAVKHYGAEFMESIRSLRFPRYNDGGLASPIPTSPSNTSISKATPNYGTLRLDFGGRSVEVLAKKEAMGILRSEFGQLAKAGFSTRRM